MIITFNKFGRKGRLGNQLFQLAAMLGFSKRYGAELRLPFWPYERYFKEKPYSTASHSVCATVPEMAYHYTPQYYDEAIKGKECVNLDGYFQSEKYWQDCKPEVLSALEFKEEFKNQVRAEYQEALSKPCIAVSIRRGDFVRNKNYQQIPVTFYINNLLKEMDDHNVIFFSDDEEYCRVHFGCLKNAYFAKNNFGLKYFDANVFAIKQLCLMSMCQRFVLSNSTFSWWGAYLSGSENVTRPEKTLDGPLAQHNEKDLYPGNWKIGENKKIDLKDVTFMIPVSRDHSDRDKNLSLNVCMLQKNFDTNIIIMEQGTREFGYYEKYGCKYLVHIGGEFHRTAMLNKIAKEASTPIIVNWDADVFISPMQVLEAVNKVRNSQADVVYPYDGRFARVDRKQWFKKLEQHLDVGIFGGTIFKGTKKDDKLSVGGAIIFNKEKYFEFGGENEKFISYGPEDVERYERFSKLSRVERIPGVIYHMDHFRGVNSRCSTNPYDKQNHDELDKIQAMSKEQLKEYVNSKEWNQITNTKIKLR